jgi:hypothetical protein
MKDEDKQRLDQSAGASSGLGDDQGTRIGSPTPGSRAKGKTGAGSEASEGIHSADGDRDEGDRSGLEGKSTGRGEGDTAHRAGSEPLESHDEEHRSKYGGGSRREDGGGQRPA